MEDVGAEAQDLRVEGAATAVEDMIEEEAMIAAIHHEVVIVEAIEVDHEGMHHTNLCKWRNNTLCHQNWRETCLTGLLTRKPTARDFGLP